MNTYQRQLIGLASVANDATTLPRTQAIAHLSHIAREIERLGREHTLTMEASDVLAVQRACGHAILTIADNCHYLPRIERVEEMLLAMAR